MNSVLVLDKPIKSFINNEVHSNICSKGNRSASWEVPGRISPIGCLDVDTERMYQHNGYGWKSLVTLPELILLGDRCGKQ